MATNTVETPTERDLGKSGTTSLAQQFPATPTDFVPSEFIYTFLDGIVSDNPVLGSFNMDYGEAPDLNEINDPGIIGLVPNPTPPGPGDVNPANKGKPPDDYPPKSSGFGDSTSPSETSKKLQVKNLICSSWASLHLNNKYKYS